MVSKTADSVIQIAALTGRCYVNTVAWIFQRVVRSVMSTSEARMAETQTSTVGGTQERSSGIVNRVKESAAAQLTTQKNRGTDALGQVANAVRSSTQKLREERLTIVDRIEFAETKTKHFIAMLGALGIDDSVLVVIDDADERVELAGRNVPNAKVLRAAGLNVYDLLRYHHLVVTKAALERIKERVAA